ncbi:MAG: channel protein hemolysin family [Armatimonadetes bacterium]|jgi:hemolysin III|nr:channel protein hemolysin family [Armatimonadota bacterium]
MNNSLNNASAGCRRALQYCRVREPFNGLSHMAGVLLSIAGLLFLIAVSIGKPWHLTSFAIYGASLVILYLASTLYHSLPVTPRRVEQLLVFDQVAIYLLIAGTYTPLCLVPLRGPWGWSLLSVVWTIALVGIVLRIAWRKSPEWVPVVLYLVMGWLCTVALKPLGAALPDGAMGWLFAGGIVYTIGAGVFATQRPRLWPGKFSSHELWHLFVLGGSACHFVLMIGFVARMP